MKIDHRLRDQIRRFSAGSSEETGIRLFALRAGHPEPVELDAAGKVDLLTRSRAGEPIKLAVEVLAYTQRDGSRNRRSVRFKPGMMQKFARSFEGRPFLRDHETDRLDARAGTIRKSALEIGEDGSRSIVMTLEAVKPWAVEGLLDGTIDALSIGWSSTGPVMCSLHNAPRLSECSCFPGDTVGDQVAEWVFTSADGVEVSAVNVPAVIEAGVEAVRELAATLDREALACILADEPYPTRGIAMFTKIAAALKLAADAESPAIIAAIDALRTDRDGLADRLTVAEQRLKAATDASNELTAQAESRLRAERAATVEGKLAGLRGRGLLKDGPGMEALRRMAERDHDGFLAQVADIEAAGVRVTPAGAPREAASADVQVSTTDEILAASPGLAESLRKAGISREQFEKFGARHAVAAITAR